MAHLNPYLIEKMNVAPEDIERLHHLHGIKDVIFSRARSGDCPDLCLEELRTVELKMQEAWGFEQDDGKHSWKYLMPNTPHTIEFGTWISEYLGREPSTEATA